MIKGSIPALITPFKNGEIDKNALEDLVEWQIEEGSNGLVAVGTTGESPTLSHEEHQEVIEIIVKKSKGKLLALGASNFTNLSNLDFVEQELNNIQSLNQKDVYFNELFTPKSLINNGILLNINSALYLLFACIPPTVAAALITASNLFFLKKKLTLS